MKRVLLLVLNQLYLQVLFNYRHHTNLLRDISVVRQYFGQNLGSLRDLSHLTP